MSLSFGNLQLVKQAVHQPRALDAAVAIAEVLISSYTRHRNGPGRGHKHAMQAIQLLASVSDRFDTTVDLFFDLVERSCAENRGQCRTSSLVAPCTDSFSTRMMQNYDQTLVRLISKQRSTNGMPNEWNLTRPMERIRALRFAYEFHDDSPLMTKSCILGMRRTSSTLFCESLRMLHSLEKKNVTGMMRPSLLGFRSRSQDLAIWARNVPARMRARQSRDLDADGVAAASRSSIYHEDPAAHQTINKMGAEITDLKDQIQMLCSVIENSARSKCKNLAAKESFISILMIS